MNIALILPGHWVYYGFGMACMYSMDYRVVGGFNLNRQGWGGEDVELYDKHVNSNLNVSAYIAADGKSYSTSGNFFLCKPQSQ